MWPPRTVAIAEMPPIDAVFFSHEHSDHFDAPTLAMLDRAIPILLPARASRAATALLEEMGFTARRLFPGDAVTIGDLELHVFTPDHVGFDNGDEWDVLPFAVRDTAGDGSFTSFVDVFLSPEAELASIDAVGGKIGVYAYTNNAVSGRFLFSGGTKTREFDTLRLLSSVSDRCSSLAHHRGEPAALLLCGSGYSFAGPDAWMNRNTFPSDNERVAAAMAAARGDHVVRAATPGEALRMEKGRVAEILPRANGICALPRAAWPDRTYVGDVTLIDSVEPFVASRSVDEADLPEIEALLDDFATYLYASPIFRSLHSLERGSLAGRKATLAFVLRADDGGYVFAWEPQARQFVSVECSDPASEYVAGVELWASDALALVRGEVEWITVQAGHFRGWTMAPQTVPMTAALFMSYFTALRRPDIFLRLYQTGLARARTDGPRLRPGGGPVSAKSAGAASR